MLHDVIRNVKKDIFIEFRSRIVVSIILSFSIIVTISVGFASGGVFNNAMIHAVMLWVIIVFSGMNTLSHIFFREIEEETAVFCMIHYTPGIIFISKLAVNILIMILVSIVVTILYIFFLSVTVYHPVALILLILTGAVSLAVSSTIVAAIAAIAGLRGGLFTILAFPIVLPLMSVAIKFSTRCFMMQNFLPTNAILFLLAFSCVVGGVSLLLFPFIWQEF